ncbi:MAG: hypothetical protein ABIQ35_10855 [Verrucomicrobiota bacterium]
MSELTKKISKRIQPEPPNEVSAINRINEGLEELKSSAATRSETMTKTHFKELVESLKQLEEQTKKQ